MIKFFRKIFNCHKTKIIKMNQQEQINWLIRQVNRMNNSHCGDGCDYTIPEGCVVWTGEPLVCGETVLANEGDRMDVVQQNIVAFLCSRESNTYSIVANEICPDGGFSFLENGVIVYSQCFSGGGNYTFENKTYCLNGGLVVSRDGVQIFDQCYECCNKKIEYNIFQNIETQLVTSSEYSFATGGYSNLTHTNSSAIQKTYGVFVSYTIGGVEDTGMNYKHEIAIDGAIIKRSVSNVDSIVWEDINVNVLDTYLTKGPNYSDIITTATTDKVLTDTGDPVSSTFYMKTLRQNVSFFSVVTLAPGEHVDLKFRSKDSSGKVLKAQMLVQEM